MRKLKLKMPDFERIEVLTREQLKMVTGGDGSGGGSGGNGVSCECDDGKSAGMTNCDNCEKWCKDNNHGGKKSCS